jgi:hypothetical protein
MTIRAHDPQGSYWQGYEWSPWSPLPQVIYAKASCPAPKEPGLYRLRCARITGLEYLGMSTNLRGRLHSLAIGAANIARGTRSVHTASRCVVAHRDHGRVVQVSWTAVDVDRAELLGIECELIAAYRQTEGRNPTYQFGVEVISN